MPPTVAAALVDDLGGPVTGSSLDARVDSPFGRRAVDWELKGVPVRVEVGPRDLAKGHVTVVRRARRQQAPVPLTAVAAEVAADLLDIPGGLFAEATERRDARTVE